MEVVRHHVHLTAGTEDAVIVVLDIPGQAVEVFDGRRDDRGIAEHYQAWLQVFGNHAVLDRMMDETSGQIAFLDARTRPINHLGGKDAANSQFLAEAKQQHIDRRRIGIGQLGEIADAHHHLGVGITIANLQVTVQALCEAEANWLEDGVDAEPYIVLCQVFDGGVEPC